MRSFLIIRYLIVSLIMLCFSISFVSADDCAFQCWDDDGSCNATECTSISSEESDTGYCKMCDLITCSAYCLGDNRENGITCNDNEQCTSGFCSGAKRAVYYQRACCPQESEWDYLKQACIDEQGNIVFQSEQEVGFNEEEYVEEYVNENNDDTENNDNNNPYLQLGGEDITESYDVYTEKETDWPGDIDTTMSGATDPNEDIYDDIFNVEKTKVKCDHNYNKKILKRSNKDKIYLVYKCKKYHILNLNQLEDISKRLGEQVTEIKKKEFKSIDEGKGKIRKVMGCLWNGKNIKDKKTGKLYFVNNCEKYHYLDTETWLDKGIQYGAPDELYHTTVDYIQDGDEIPSTVACSYRGQNIRNKKNGAIFYISKHCKKRHYPNWETFKYYMDNILHQGYTDLSSDTVKKIPEGKDIPKIKIKAKIKKQWTGRQEVDLGGSEITYIDIYNKGNVSLKYKIETQGSSWLGIFKNWKVINQGTWYTIKEDGHASIIVSLDARFIGTKGDYEDLIKVYTSDIDNEVKELPIKIEVEDFKRDAEEVSHNVYYPSGRNFAFPGEEITIQFNIKNNNKKGHPWVDECHDYGCESYGLRYTYGNNKVNWESYGNDELFIGSQINVKDTWEKDISFTIPKNTNSGGYTTEWQMFYYPKSRNRLDFGPKMFVGINVEGQGIGGGWPEDVNIVPNADGFLTYPLESVDDNYVISGWYRNGGGSHSGIDYSPDNSGDYYVAAAADGVVSPTHYYTNYGNLISQYNGLGSCISSDPTAAYGNRIMIDHDNGYTTVYGHFEKDSILVSPGDPVTKGQRLGKMGNTGCSTGKHLHFEVRSGSTKIDPYGIKSSAINYPDRIDPNKECGIETKNLWTSCPPSLANSEEEPQQPPKEEIPDEEDETNEYLNDIQRKLNELVSKGKLWGYNVAADCLDHFLGNTGETKTLDVNWLRDYWVVEGAEGVNENRFKDSIMDRAKQLEDGETMIFVETWDRTFTAIPSTDLYLTAGTSTITSRGDFTLVREGNIVYVSGSASHKWWDRYDWDPEKDSKYLWGVSQKEAHDLDLAGRAESYDLEAKWEKQVSGTVKLRWLLTTRNIEFHEP
jgi:murein DD-endopeptidase MepM/ murein hydrolase activator NlpD